MLKNKGVMSRCRPPIPKTYSPIDARWAIGGFISIRKITIGTELRTSIEHDELQKAKFNGMVISLTNRDSKYLYS